MRSTLDIWVREWQVRARKMARDVSKHELTQKTAEYLRNRPYLQNVPYWIAALLVGYTAVVYADLFKGFAEYVQHLFEPGWTRYFLLLFTPLCFVLSWGIVEKYSPTSGGSGIPQVMAAIHLDSTYPKRWIGVFASLKVAFFKVFSSLLCVLGGGAIGREGPTIQIAASLFHWMGNVSRRFWPRTTHQPWIIAGGAAGIAAAFNTPLGGIVFAIEELAPEYFSRFKTVLLSAVIIAGMVAQYMWGPYLYFGFPHVPEPDASFLYLAPILGALCGFAGGLFGKVLLVGLKKTAALGRVQRYQLAAGLGLSVALLGLFLGPEVLGGGDELVRDLLSDDSEAASWGLVAGRFLTTILTYLSGVAGGIFAPSLSLGAAIGSKVESLVQSGNGNLMVLLGMSAFLSGVTRAPFTSLVLVFEMTNRHSAIFYLMLASVTAYAAARVVDGKSFYQHRMEHYLSVIQAHRKKIRAKK